ncbi:unnamed protein product [Ophioblennius macclurei]
MLATVLIFMCFVALHSAADLCNWTGSGAGMDSRSILQVRLRCTEGSVRWVYPGHALRVVLEPNLSSARRTIVCIKPSPTLDGSNAYIERAGELELLVTDGNRHVRCFWADGPHRATVYLQVSPQMEGSRSRRTIGFRYELLGNRSTAPHTLEHAGRQPDRAETFGGAGNPS